MKDVSALMDGELERRRVRSTISRLEGQDELRDAWATFHVIRDALQGNAVGSSRFIEKFHERLEQEPLSVVPRWRSRLPRLRTMALAGLAALLIAGMFAWLAPDERVPPSTFIDAGLSDSVAIEYAMAHRQLVPAFVAGPPARAPAAPGAGATAGGAR
ncbi:MAG: sigma-E factor negative regulatory protein [bacterium]